MRLSLVQVPWPLGGGALPTPPLAVPAVEGATALKGFVDCVAAVVWGATDLAGGTGPLDSGSPLDIHMTKFVSDSVALSLQLLTFAGSSGASAAERDAFWTEQLLKQDTVAILKAATLEVGELTRLDHVGLSLQRAAARISGERNVALAGQLAAASAATAVAELTSIRLGESAARRTARPGPTHTS